jgi:ribonucleoside-triphosphate reductase
MSISPITVAKFLNYEIGADALPEPQWGPIGKEVYQRTYSRDGEVWAETVRRVVLGSLSYTDEKMWLTDEPVKLFSLLYEFKAIPAGRHLWVTGTPVSTLSKNCWAVGFGVNTYSHFQFLAERLFEGGGVGANYSHDLVGVTQPIRSTMSLFIRLRADHPDFSDVAEITALNVPAPADAVVVHVPDTREGWVSTWVTLFATACRSDTHTNLIVDISDVRPYGFPLKTFGGTASGPAALVRSLVAINDILSEVTGRQLSGLDSMRIDHEIACAVVAGGARRSARMSIMSWRDPDVMEFINAKANSGSHWTTNISVEIDDEFRDAVSDVDHPDHALAQSVLDAVSAGMAANGEPGFVDTEMMSLDEPRPIRITNPCGEANLVSFDSELGVIGESCNLGSVDLDAFGTDIEGAHEAFEIMSRFLYRATLNPHKDPRAHTIEKESRRIGVGFMGLQGWAAAHGVRLSDIANSSELRQHLTDFRHRVRRAADELADSLGTPRSVKVTAIAPTGTIAQLRGTQPGVHPVFARYFLRRVRYANSDPQLVELAKMGYNIEPDLYTAQTSVVEYVVRDSILDRFPDHLIEQSDELNLAQFLGLLEAVQTTFCGYGDGQSISATAQIPPMSDPRELSNVLSDYFGKVKGITVFPAVSRPQSPYEAISQIEYEASAGPVQMVGDSNSGECVGASCPIR